MSLGIAYPGLIYRTTAERLLRGEDIELDNKRYVLAGFNAPSKSEEILFKYLSTREQGAEFYWDYDDYYVNGDDNHEAGLFLRSNIARYPATDHISHDNFTAIKKQLGTTACVSNVVQVKHIAEIVASLPADELDKRTAIVLTDENMLIPLLYSLPKSVQSVNVTMGYPLKTTLAYSLLERIISLQSHCRTKEEKTLFYHADVTGLLSHPYIVDCYAERASELISNITTNKITSVGSELFAEDELFGVLFGRKHQNWRELYAYIIEVMSHILDKIDNVDNAQREYLRIAIEELRKLGLSIENCGIDIPIEVCISLLRRHLQTLNIPYEGEPIEGIQIMGILETRNIDFKNVIILSMLM